LFYQNFCFTFALRLTKQIIRIMELKKVIRDGKVGIIYSSGYGAGWYSWNTDVPQCLFSPEIIELIESEGTSIINDDYCEKLFNVESFYSGGSDGLRVEWLPIGTHFDIHEYDGAEHVQTFDDIKLIA